MSRILVLLGVAASVVAAAFGGVANAAPDNGNTLTYSFTECSSGSDFEAVKQESEAAALHLADGSGKFVAMTAIVAGDQTVDGTFYEDGTTLFETAGFTGRNKLPTITCLNTSPLSGITAWVTGYVAPTK